MSDETHAEAEQLFDSQGDEVADDANDTEGTQENENPESEQEQEGLELEEDKAPLKAEKVKLDQIRAFQDKLDKGEITLEKIPKAQEWIRKYLRTPEKEPEVDHKAIARELAKEAIREEREENKYLDLKESLNAIKPDKGQKEMIKDKFRFFLSKGLSKFEALMLATEFAKVDFTGLGEKRRRMTIPQPGTRKNTKEIDWDAPFGEIAKNVPPEKVFEHLKSLVR